MPYTVRAFFENGGTTCDVVRVAASTSVAPFTVPRTASFTMPVGDLASQVTTLSQASVSGKNTLTVTSTAGLSTGAVIVIGDPTASAVSVVASVVDAQNLTLSGPLATGAAAGTPVWLLAATVLPDGATPGQTQVQVASTAGFNPGDTVAVTADGMREVADVDGLVNANTVQRTRKLQGTYPAGALLRRSRRACASRLSAPATGATACRST